MAKTQKKSSEKKKKRKKSSRFRAESDETPNLGALPIQDPRPNNNDMG